MWAPVPVDIAPGVIGGGNPPVTSVEPPVAISGTGWAVVRLTLAAECEEPAPVVAATWGAVFAPDAPLLPEVVWEEEPGT